MPGCLQGPLRASAFNNHMSSNVGVSITKYIDVFFGFLLLEAELNCPTLGFAIKGQVRRNFPATKLNHAEAAPRQNHDAQ